MVPIEYDKAFFANPHPTYARLCAQAPAVPIRDPNGLVYWLVTRYGEARTALGHVGLSKDPRHAWAALRDAGLVAGDPGDATASMLIADPPEHTRLRAPVVKAFTVGQVSHLRPRIQQITDRLLDQAFGSGPADLIDAVAFPLSVTVMCELLGVPVDDRDDFRVWTTAAHTPTYVTDAPMPRQEGARRLRDYVSKLVARRRSHPVTGATHRDLIGTLVADPAGQLTDAEVGETVSHLLLAGQDATTNLIGNGLYALLSHPEQFALLRDHPGLIETAVEELMRYDGPTARSSPRFATQDVDLGAVTIPSGSVVVVGLSAANRDPARFADPDRVDITRAENPHLAFGHGAHFCVAAALARSAGQIAIGTLLRRFGHLALACRPEHLRWRPTPVFRGLVHLPVTAGREAT